MALERKGDLFINGINITYEGNVKIEDGSITRVPNIQTNGDIVYTNDLTTNRSKIMVPIRVNSASNNTFDEFYNNEDNNVITYRDKNYTRCVMEVKPEREDEELTEYVFFGNPAV